MVTWTSFSAIQNQGVSKFLRQYVQQYTSVHTLYIVSTYVDILCGHAYQGSCGQTECAM